MAGSKVDAANICLPSAKGRHDCPIPIPTIRERKAEGLLGRCGTQRCAVDDLCKRPRRG